MEATVGTAGKRRTGKPFTIYLAEDQFLRLNTVAKQRRVAKSALVRYALERLIEQMEDGQFELPLGLAE
jgi:predicted DNA-binding protein